MSVTLGGGQDEQRIEDIMGEPSESRFMLHYNFPPFSVGEVRSMRAPGRREIGHGYLGGICYYAKYFHERMILLIPFVSLLIC